MKLVLDYAPAAMLPSSLCVFCPETLTSKIISSCFATRLCNGHLQDHPHCLLALSRVMRRDPCDPCQVRHQGRTPPPPIISLALLVSSEAAALLYNDQLRIGAVWRCAAGDICSSPPAKSPHRMVLFMRRLFHIERRWRRGAVGGVGVAHKHTKSVQMTTAEMQLQETHSPPARP